MLSEVTTNGMEITFEHSRALENWRSVQGPNFTERLEKHHGSQGYVHKDMITLTLPECEWVLCQ